MLQPNNAKNCPVCRVRFDTDRAREQPKPDEKQSTKKLQIKYAKKLTSIYRDLSDKWSEFSDQLTSHVFQSRPLEQRNELEISPRLLVDPLPDDSSVDAEAAKAIWDIFSRTGEQKVAAVSTLGSTACETYRDHLSAKRMEILTLALKMYNTKRKLGNSRITSKIAQINLIKDS